MSRQLSLIAVLVAVLIGGCGGEPESSAAVPQASEAPQGQFVLAPAKRTPIVKFQGLVNGGKAIHADMASFDALPQQSMTVVEPFLNESMTFTGVGFADVLSAAGATGETVTIHALDDYEATLDTDVLREPGVMLATGVEGQAIDVGSGGPVRLIFPAASETGKDSDMWVWSIDEITVE